MTKNRCKDLLGVDTATASNQLKKLVFFDMVKKLELDCCLRCGMQIATAEELSMDHVKPWRPTDNGAPGDAGLFWNLDNVAFSHRRCNKADRPRRKVGPPGTAWCYEHKEFLSTERFGVQKSRWNGLNYACKACDAERSRRKAAAHPRFPCPSCRTPMRKTCGGCNYDLPMKDYMALRRSEGATY